MLRYSMLVMASLCLAQTPEAEKPKALFPVITAVVNGASFQPGIASGGWATILSTDLATTMRGWTDLDFVNGVLPPSLSSTGVIIGGRAAYVAYISPTQINLLVADDPTVGNVTVLVTESFNSSNIVFASKMALAPALFSANGKLPVAAHNSDGTLVAPTTPAHACEVVQLFGTGFGPTNPVIPTGMLFTTPAAVTGAISATVGGVIANVQGYLIYPGVYQLNVTVPDVRDGDAPVLIKIGGNSTQVGLLLPVGK
jgi:uncharacterized protein (TIGR03437 family)